MFKSKKTAQLYLTTFRYYITIKNIYKFYKCRIALNMFKINVTSLLIIEQDCRSNKIFPSFYHIRYANLESRQTIIS